MKWKIWDAPATAIETCHVVADKLISHARDFALKVLNSKPLLSTEPYLSPLHWLQCALEVPDIQQWSAALGLPEVYLRVLLLYYSLGELSYILARNAGPYIHVGQAWRDYILPKIYNGDIDIMRICLIWTLLVHSILGRFLLPYWDVSFVHLNTPPCLAYGVSHCIGKTRWTWIYGLLFLLKVYSKSLLHNLWGCSGTGHPFHY